MPVLTQIKLVCCTKPLLPGVGVVVVVVGGVLEVEGTRSTGSNWFCTRSSITKKLTACDGAPVTVAMPLKESKLLTYFQVDTFQLRAVL